MIRNKDRCPNCNEPFIEDTDEHYTMNIEFHKTELCKIPIRQRFKDYLLKQGHSETEIQKYYECAMIKFKHLGNSREITVEVYTRDMLVHGFTQSY